LNLPFVNQHQFTALHLEIVATIVDPLHPNVMIVEGFIRMTGRRCFAAGSMLMHAAPKAEECDQSPRCYFEPWRCVCDGGCCVYTITVFSFKMRIIVARCVHIVKTASLLKTLFDGGRCVHIVMTVFSFKMRIE
jgi:hypothetical protein